MKTTPLILNLAAFSAAGALALAAGAANEEPVERPRDRPTPTAPLEMIELLRQASPDEAETLLREYRERQPLIQPQEREALMAISPEERQARIDELRRQYEGRREASRRGVGERQGLPSLSRARLEGIEALREDLRQLSPEERRQRLRQWRQERLQAADAEGPDAARLPNERRPENRVVDVRERVVQRIALLEERKEAGTLSEEEQVQLERMQDLLRRLEQIRQPNPVPPEPSDGLPPAPAADGN